MDVHFNSHNHDSVDGTPTATEEDKSCLDKFDADDKSVDLSIYDINPKETNSINNTTKIDSKIHRQMNDSCVNTENNVENETENFFKNKK